MTIWVDAQLSPEIATFLTKQFAAEAFALKDLNLRDAKDLEIFQKAREAGAVIMTKDQDFSILLERLGPPPKVIWITCGNTSNEFLTNLLSNTFSEAIAALESGDVLVELF
jgi:predicted nuclease of predicted toxin-antitoxin system